MKHIKLFEQFVNERKDWYDYDASKIAKGFMRDNGKNADADDMHQWLDMFAQDKRIEDETPVDVLEDIIDILNKNGYKLNADAVVAKAPYAYR